MKEFNLFFCYYVDAPVGYENSGWHILHISTHTFLFESLKAQNRVACEGLRKEVESFVRNQISDGNAYKSYTPSYEYDWKIKKYHDLLAQNAINPDGTDLI